MRKGEREEKGKRKGKEEKRNHLWANAWQGDEPFQSGGNIALILVLEDLHHSLQVAVD